MSTGGAQGLEGKQKRGGGCVGGGRAAEDAEGTGLQGGHRAAQGRGRGAQLGGRGEGF